MTTAREFITLAMKEAGVLGVGQSLLAEDINDGFTYLRRMLAQWQKRRWLVPGLTHISMPGNGEKSNKIGPGQYYNAMRPSEIKAAWFTQNNVNGNDRVSFNLERIWSYENYARLALKELNTWPQYFFYDGDYPYGNVYIWPIPSSIYTINLVTQLPIGFNSSVADGTYDGGSGYVDGVYPNIPLTLAPDTEDEGQIGFTGNFTVAGGIVTDFEIFDGGNGYRINDQLTVDNADLGGTGSGFLFDVTNVEGTLDNEFNMPEEYEEPIHSNLVIRLAAGYNKPTNPTTVALAKVGLNTIRKANAQIPTLQMPRALQGPKGFNIYNPDGGNIN
jgi:hypothetical protein